MFTHYSSKFWRIYILIVIIAKDINETTVEAIFYDYLIFAMRETNIQTMSLELPLFDYHIHTLPHGLNQRPKMEEIIQASVEKGLKAICLTDHFPLPPGYKDPTAEEDCAMPLADYEVYQVKVGQLINEYHGLIEVRRGAEFDWLPEYRSWTKVQTKKWPFDYLIGSVHFLGQIADGRGTRNLLLDYEEEEFLGAITFHGGIKPLVEAYYRSVRDMVRSGLFDGVGHLDLIKKYNNGNLFFENEDWYQDTVSETLKDIANLGMALEINTAGLTKKCKSMYPSLWILTKAKQMGIPLTIGSDGHSPELVGNQLHAAINYANDAGYTSLVRFRSRKMMVMPIV